MGSSRKSGNVDPIARIGKYRIPHAAIEVYEQAAADVYCAFGVGTGSADVAAFCGTQEKKFVLFAGSDLDFSEQYYPASREVNFYGSRGDVCHYVIESADAIVVQTEGQLQLLSERFGYTGNLLRNPVDLTGVTPTCGPRMHALWVGKSDVVKQPDLLIRLARDNPDMRFVMIMNRSDATLHEIIVARAPDNVELIESVSFQDVDRYYAEVQELGSLFRLVLCSLGHILTPSRPVSMALLPLLGSRLWQLKPRVQGRFYQRRLLRILSSHLE